MTTTVRPAVKPAKTMMVIEREARWRSWLLFAVLVAAMYVMVGVVLLAGYLTLQFVWVERLTGEISWLPGWRPSVVVFALATACAVGYWFLSRIDAKGRLLKAMHATPLDPADRFHKRLADVVEEMRLATGAPHLECVVVAATGMNAFAFSDMRGSGCIGVTEGALSRLSRQQLQAVVAHEVAHVLSGDYVTTTSACLLFGIYSGASDALLAAAVRGGSVFVSIGAMLLWVLLAGVRLGSSIVNAAISRDRELAADMAAVRFTRDPLSLAQALHMMRRHPGGAGFIPSGLSPLCIRPTDFGGGGGRIDRWFATHPPIDTRIVRLLNVAHVGFDEFTRQAADAEGTLEGREHSALPPRPLKLGLHEGLAGFTATGVMRIGESAVAAGPAAAALLRTASTPVTPAAGSSAMASPVGAFTCPACGDGLVDADYEGVGVKVCDECAGRLVSESGVKRIVTRRTVAFTDGQQRLADLVAERGDALRRAAVLARSAPQSGLVACPRCGRTMMRRHYDYDHAVEVDRCPFCELVWFEKDELEVLQILIERQAG
jgi:Zn-dependent protease with chaperone function/Zn-finger nucleic acid-binding protein